MVGKKLIAFLVASLLFAVIVVGQILLAQDVTTRIVYVKQNETKNRETTKSNDRNPVEFTVTVSPSANEVGNEDGKANSAEHYYKDGNKKSNQIDCGKATSFSDLIACESLKTQNSVDHSTVGIRDWTIVSAVFSFFAFGAAAFSVYFLWRSNGETKKSNILQLQPWVVIKKPKVTLRPDIKLRDEYANLIVEFKIINEGKTPITAAHIDLYMVNATAISVGPFDMGESLITLEGGLVSDTTFQPINQGKSGKIKIIVPCKRTGGDENAVSFLYAGQLFYDIRASVKIRDSFTRKGRCRFFYIRSSREKGVMSEGRYESRKRHIVTSEFAGFDSGVFNINRAYKRMKEDQK